MPQLTSEKFLNQLQRLCPDYRQKKFLLAVSGGADSMVLANLFLSEKLNFEIAHVNYHLREEASNLDEKLVHTFCEENNIKGHSYEVSDKDQKPENSIELWARELRYRFFFEIIDKEEIDFIVTGHHLNDQLETFLVNLSKASGLAGLTGIPENANRILRPLLHFTKKDIYNFAEKHSIDFREDQTNFEEDFLRNRIRLNITPEIEKTNSHFWENFDKSLTYLSEAKSFIEDQLQEILDKILISKTNDKIILDKAKLTAQSDFVKYELLKKFGFTNREEQQKIFKATTGKIFKGDQIYLTIDISQLLITKELQSVEPTQEFDLEINKELTFPLNILVSNKKLVSTRISWEIDSSKIKFPLKLRQQKSGDSFNPKGMIGKKLVSKFFKDEKISILARQKIWLLVDSEGQIIGILNHRQDGRFVSENEYQKLYIYL